MQQQEKQEQKRPELQHRSKGENMTRINIAHKENGYSVIVEGHAENPLETTGNILCAAVSILSYTLIEMIEHMRMEGQAAGWEIIDNGYVEAFVEPQNGFEEKVRAVIETILKGFEILEENYPEQIAVGELHERN